MAEELGKRRSSEMTEGNLELSSLTEIRQITHDDSELWTKMGQLRADTYIRKHDYLDASTADENGAEFDEYDWLDSTSHYVILDNQEQIVATARLLYSDHSDQALPLPAEKLFPDDFDQTTDGYMEASRLIVSREALSKDTGLVDAFVSSAYLLRTMTQEAAEKDVPVYAVSEPWMLSYLEKIGVGCEVLVNEPQFTERYNSNNILLKIDPHAVTRHVHQRDLEGRFPANLHQRGMPEKLAPFFESDRALKGLGKIALSSFESMPSEQWDRNLGWLNRQEQTRLAESSVAIAGAGGDGGELAVTLAKLGVGKFTIADPERFELQNLNRQAGASYSTLGRNKAEVIAEIVQDINPMAEVEVLTDGVTIDNIDQFMGSADIVVDETEYTSHEVGVMLARAARQRDLPVVVGLNVGFGSYVTSFHPQGETFESCLGLDEADSLQDIADTEVPLRKWVHHVPSYSDMNTFAQVESDEVSTPTVAPGVNLAAGSVSTQTLAHLLQDISPQRAGWITYAPGGQSIDAVDGYSRVKHPSSHFAWSAFKAAARTKFNLNPPSGYSM